MRRPNGVGETALFAAEARAETPDHADPALWPYADTQSNQPADVFFIAPTLVKGDASPLFFTSFFIFVEKVPFPWDFAENDLRNRQKCAGKMGDSMV